MAAKKSRDQRKLREETVAMRAGLLEKENAVLRAQLSNLREEKNSLEVILMKRSQLRAEKISQREDLMQQLLSRAKAAAVAMSIPSGIHLHQTSSPESTFPNDARDQGQELKSQIIDLSQRNIEEPTTKEDEISVTDSEEESSGTDSDNRKDENRNEVDCQSLHGSDAQASS